MESWNVVAQQLGRLHQENVSSEGLKAAVASIVLPFAAEASAEEQAKLKDWVRGQLRHYQFAIAPTAVLGSVTRILSVMQSALDLL